MSLPSAPAQATMNVLQSLDETDMQLRGRWLMFARIVWIGIALLTLCLVIASIPSDFVFLQVHCSGPLATCANNGRLMRNLHVFEALGLSLDAFALYQVALFTGFTLVYTAIGVLIFWRKSDDRMALFASLTLIMFPAAFNDGVLATLPSIWTSAGQVVIFLGDISIFLFFFLFPTGHFIPRWVRWLWCMVIAYWVVRIFFPSLSLNASIPFTVALPVFVCCALVAQVYRYRRVSSPLQRQQTRWVVFGITVGLGGYLVTEIVSSLFLPLIAPGPLDLISGPVVYGFILLVPLSIGVAILRSHLFDIDLIINRTLVYGLLTAIVVGLYMLVVGGLGELLQVRGNLIISLLATGLIAVLFQPLRARLQQTMNRLMYGDRDDPYRIISRLGTQLEATLTPDAILPAVAETVAKTLKLPCVAIELKEEGELRRVAVYGTPVEPSLRLPLRYQQETIGQMLLASRSPGESFSSVDRHLLDDLARQAGIAANAVLLSEDLQRSHERLLLAREEERRRLARELHDSVSQALYGISLGAHAARTALQRDPQQVTEPLDYVLSLAEAALTEMRALIFELRPESLETEGLISAFAKQAAALQARHELAVSTTLCEEPDLPLPVKQELYRVAQEAMHNTVKHAHANHVDLRLDQTSSGVLLEIHDDGTGFDPTASFPGHLGLHSMRERIASLGGTFEIESAPGSGTRICVCVSGAG